VRYVRAFGRFWYDFVIGDDPKIAIAVVAALAATALLLVTGAVPVGWVTVVGGALVVAAFTASLLIDVRRE